MSAYTIDASVWVASFEPGDRFHAQSVELLRTLESDRTTLWGPAIVLLEVSCALSRRTRNAEIAEVIEERLRAHPLLALRAVDDELLFTACRLGASRFLRSADALYLATAALEDAALITWDRELLSRAEAISPEQALREMGG